MENYRSEDDFYAYKDRLLAAFRESELAKKYAAKRQPRLVADADLMLQVGHNYYSADQIYKWTAFDLEDFCLRHLPYKLVASPSAFREMGHNLTVFVRWLHAEGLVANGENLLEIIRGLPDKMVEVAKRY